MNDRPTPETDSHALKAEDIDEGGNFEAVHANIARLLERQRDELLDELTVIRTVASYPHHPNALHAIQSIAKNAIAAARKEGA
jgi:hypothetical protein